MVNTLYMIWRDVIYVFVCQTFERYVIYNHLKLR